MHHIDFYKNVKTFGPEDETDNAVKSSMKELDYIFKNFDLIDGHLLEFGVFQGRSLKKISELVKNKKIFGFDSFIGLPEPWIINQNLTYSAGHFETSQIPDLKNVIFYQGFFDKTIQQYLNDYPENNISFLHIDCDLYSSSKEILFNLNDKIVPGTIIRFDELTDWRLVSEESILGKGPLYTEWKTGEWKSLLEWIDAFDRKVSPISRNFIYSSTMIVEN